MSPIAPYSARQAPCGCRGLPEGQHLPGCESQAGAEAPECRRCGYRAATDQGRCAICGTSREAIPPAPAAPMLLSDAELEHPFGPGIEAPERLHWLRTATHDCFRVDLWDAGERTGAEAELAYRLCVGEGAQWILAFAGEGFAVRGDAELLRWHPGGGHRALLASPRRGRPRALRALHRAPARRRPRARARAGGLGGRACRGLWRGCRQLKGPTS